MAEQNFNDNIAIKLHDLQKHLNEIISTGKNIVDNDYKNINTNKILKACKETEKEIELYAKTDEYAKQPYAVKLRLENLKSYLAKLTKAAAKLQSTPIPSPPRKDKCPHGKTKRPPSPSNIRSLEQNISATARKTKDYDREGLLPASTEDFLKSCDNIKKKLNTLPGKKQVKAIKDLQDQVQELEELALDVRYDGLVETESLDDFLRSCRNFKSKLAGITPEMTEETQVLIDNLDEVIGLSKEAKQGGYCTDSIENFTKKCENVKQRIVKGQIKVGKNEEKQRVLENLKSSVDNIMDIINNYKKQGLISSSLQEFMKTCKATRAKIEDCEKEPSWDSGEMLLSPDCSAACTCCDIGSINELIADVEGQSKFTQNSEDDTSNMKYINSLIKRSGSNYKSQSDSKSTDKDLKPSIKTQPKIVQRSEHNFIPASRSIVGLLLRGTFTKPNNDENDIKEWKAKVDEENDIQQEEETSDLSSIIIYKKSEHSVDNNDEDRGNHETKVRQICQIKRTKEESGMIKEERKIIIIREEKRDLHESELRNNGGLKNLATLSADPIATDNCLQNGKTVALSTYISSNNNNVGFVRPIRKVRSESTLKQPSMTDPIIRKSISMIPL